MTCLSGKLASLSQKTNRIRTDNFDFMKEIAGLPNLSQTVLLIEGFNWECGREGLSVLTEFNKHRDYFVDNHIRAIFWLYENELSEFTQDATECWILRQRVVDFSELPQAASQPVQALDTFWQEAGDSLPGSELTDESYAHILDLAKKNQANADHANRLLSQGILGWRKGNSQKAIKYLRLAAGIAKILGNKSLQSQCQNALALANTKAGNEEDAIRSYENAANLSPKSGYLWNNLGQLLARKERNEEAITAFKKAVEVSPQDFMSWDGLGHVYLKMGLHQNAISAFEKALEISPTCEFSWSGIGQAYLESGQLEKAAIPLGKAVKLNPRAVDTWRNLASALPDWIASGTPCPSTSRRLKPTRRKPSCGRNSVDCTCRPRITWKAYPPCRRQSPCAPSARWAGSTWHAPISRWVITIQPPRSTRKPSPWSMNRENAPTC